MSHRIRRQPSIFSVGWFRIALGIGLVLVLALLVGPSVASWFGSDLPRSLFLLVPWSAPEKTAQPRAPEPVAPQPSLGSPGPASSGPVRGAAATGGGSGTPSRPTAPAATSPRGATRDLHAGAAPERPGSLAAPPAVYWVQVGAFLDHRNADRLVDRLRSDGLSAATTSFEQSRVLYRVLLAGADGSSVSDDAIERVRGLGHPVETTAEGPAVTGLVPLRRAVETSHALRQQGVPVRLKQEVSSATYRVVRVGSFATIAEAEAALAALNVRGVEGVVVRER